MASLGDMMLNITAKDDFSKTLQAFEKQMDASTSALKKVGEETVYSGVAVAAFGQSLMMLSPGFQELGKLVRGFGLVQGAVGGFINRAPVIQMHMLSLAGALKHTGGYVANLTTAFHMISSSVGILLKSLLSLSPIILGLMAVGFALYTVWTENFFGIQDIVMGVIGDISTILSGLIDFLKGVVIGVIDNLKYVFIGLGTILQPILSVLSWLAHVFMKSSDSAFNMGRIIGHILTPAIVIWGVSMLSTAIPALWAMTLALWSQVTAFIAGIIPAVIAFGTALFTTVIPAVWAFTTALLANPFTWVAIAIMLVIAGLGYLVTHLRQVGEFFKKVWGFIKEAFKISPLGLFIEALKWVWEKLKAISSVSEFFKTIWEGIKAVFLAITNPIEFISKFFSTISKIFGKGGGEGKEEKGGVEKATNTLSATGGSANTTSYGARNQSVTSNVNMSGNVSGNADAGLFSRRIAKETSAELGGMS